MNPADASKLELLLAYVEECEKDAKDRNASEDMFRYANICDEIRSLLTTNQQKKSEESSRKYRAIYPGHSPCHNDPIDW